MKDPVPPDDAERVAALHRLGVLDQPPAPDLDALTRLAAFVTGSPIGAVSLLDADRAVAVSASGVERQVVRRQDSMCQHTVAEGRTVSVPDARLDPRFRDNPFVNGLRGDVRLYCGVPLHDTDGFSLGTLCVADTRVRTLSDAQLSALEDLAEQVEHLFELRRQHARLVQLLAEVDHHATHDGLTGLVNRRLLMDRLGHAIARTWRGGHPPVVFFCDLDGFKSVNDDHGHEAGDAVLVEVARRLLALMRPGDTVTRLGGDEFVVLCEDLPAEHTPGVAGGIRSATR